MSFVITLQVREGIVMASDSRLTLNATKQGGDGPIVHLAAAQTDSTNKTFLASGSIGISTHGAAEVNSVPISGFVESFINEKVVPNELEVDEVPEALLEYFHDLPTIPQTQFHVAGFKHEGESYEPHVWTVNVHEDNAVRSNNGTDAHVAWGGEADVITRLLKPVILNEGGAQQELPNVQVPFNFFTLQDAIDFALFAVRTTIDSIRFQARPKTVGGPIDILVLKPLESSWIQRKRLVGETRD